MEFSDERVQRFELGTQPRIQTSRAVRRCAQAMVDKDWFKDCSGSEQGSIQQHTYQGFNTLESDQITSQYSAYLIELETFWENLPWIVLQLGRYNQILLQNLKFL